MQSKSMIFNVDGNECMFVQASPISRTMDVFINGEFKTVIAVNDIINQYL